MGKLFDGGYYNEIDIKNEGFRRLGKNIKIARNCTIINVENISIGNNVRIDAYTTIIASGDGYVDIGSYVHIGTCCLMIGGDGIIMEDFSNLSHGSKIYSRADDMSGEYLVNPLVPEELTNVSKGCVTLKRHSVIGTSSVLLPGITVGEGAVVGALSLVNKNLPGWGVYFGASARKIGERSKKLLELEKKIK